MNFAQCARSMSAAPPGVFQTDRPKVDEVNCLISMGRHFTGYFLRHIERLVVAGAGACLSVTAE
jgi:hypothetical protein